MRLLVHYIYNASLEIIASQRIKMKKININLRNSTGYWIEWFLKSYCNLSQMDFSSNGFAFYHCLYQCFCTFFSLWLSSPDDVRLYIVRKSINEERKKTKRRTIAINICHFVLLQLDTNIAMISRERGLQFGIHIIHNNFYPWTSFESITKRWTLDITCALFRCASLKKSS